MTDLARQRAGEVWLSILRRDHPEVDWVLVGETEPAHDPEPPRATQPTGSLARPLHEHPIGKRAA